MPDYFSRGVSQQAQLMLPSWLSEICSQICLFLLLACEQTCILLLLLINVVILYLVYIRILQLLTMASCIIHILIHKIKCRTFVWCEKRIPPKAREVFSVSDFQHMRSTWMQHYSEWFEPLVLIQIASKNSLMLQFQLNSALDSMF